MVTRAHPYCLTTLCYVIPLINLNLILINSDSTKILCMVHSPCSPGSVPTGENLSVPVPVSGQMSYKTNKQLNRMFIVVPQPLALAIFIYCGYVALLTSLIMFLGIV